MPIQIPRKEKKLIPDWYLIGFKWFFPTSDPPLPLPVLVRELWEDTFLGQQEADQNKENKIFKSLFALMALVVGSAWTCCMFGLLSKQVDDEFFKLYVYLTVVNSLAMCSSTFNGPILILFRFNSLKWNSFLLIRAHLLYIFAHKLIPSVCLFCNFSRIVN